MTILRSTSAAIVLALAVGSFPLNPQAEEKPDYMGMARQFAECSAMYESVAAGDQGAAAVRESLHNVGVGARMAGAWILFISQSGNKPLNFFMDMMVAWRDEYQTDYAGSLSLAEQGGPDAIKRFAAERQALTKRCFSLQDLQVEMINQARKATLGQQ